MPVNHEVHLHRHNVLTFPSSHALRQGNAHCADRSQLVIEKVTAPHAVFGGSTTPLQAFHSRNAAIAETGQPREYPRSLNQCNALGLGTVYRGPTAQAIDALRPFQNPKATKLKDDPRGNEPVVYSIRRDILTAYAPVESVLTCPECGHSELETMSVNACLIYYECKGCGTILHPNQGDCCVFCSFGSVKCPPMQGQP